MAGSMLITNIVGMTLGNSEDEIVLSDPNALIILDLLCLGQWCRLSRPSRSIHEP